MPCRRILGLPTGVLGLVSSLLGLVSDVPVGVTGVHGSVTRVGAPVPRVLRSRPGLMGLDAGVLARLTRPLGRLTRQIGALTNVVRSPTRSQALKISDYSDYFRLRRTTSCLSPDDHAFDAMSRHIDKESVMNREQKARHEMFVRVDKFGVEHQALFPDTSMGGQAFAVVKNAVAAIEQYLSRQVMARADAQRVKAATRAAVYNYMKTIVITARRVTALDPVRNPFRLPVRRSAAALLATARAFIEEAGQRQDEFIRRGLPPTFVADFAALVDRLDTAVHVRLTSQTDRRHAAAGLASALATGFEAVRELDAIVPNTLQLDPVRRAAWQRARQIEAVNATSPVKAPQTAEPGPEPATAPEVKAS